MPPLRPLLLLLLWTVLGAGPALGGERRDEAERALQRGPVASAAEIPALASLLEKAQWTPTPELSGVFRPGQIFEVTQTGHRVLAADCIRTPPQENTYTSAELISSLQTGVSVRSPTARAQVSGSLIKKVKFSTPTHLTIPRLDLILEDGCIARLQQLPAETLAGAYVVQEVLRAEIAEQTCGRLDASGRIVALGEADAELASACAQISLEPVAVGYRTLPLASLLPSAPAPTPIPSPLPTSFLEDVRAPQGVYGRDQWALRPADGTCPWPAPQSVNAEMVWLHVDGLSIDVRGKETRTRIQSDLMLCGYTQAAWSFDSWRRARRATNGCALSMYGAVVCSPFTAIAAGKRAKDLEESIRARR